VSHPAGRGDRSRDRSPRGPQSLQVARGGVDLVVEIDEHALAAGCHGSDGQTDHLRKIGNGEPRI
jgi:hypothetical protein